MGGVLSMVSKPQEPRFLVSKPSKPSDGQAWSLGATCSPHFNDAIVGLLPSDRTSNLQKIIFKSSASPGCVNMRFHQTMQPAIYAHPAGSKETEKKGIDDTDCEEKKKIESTLICSYFHRHDSEGFDWIVYPLQCTHNMVVSWQPISSLSSLTDEVVNRRFRVLLFHRSSGLMLSRCPDPSSPLNPDLLVLSSPASASELIPFFSGSADEIAVPFVWELECVDSCWSAGQVVGLFWSGFNVISTAGALYSAYSFKSSASVMGGLLASQLLAVAPNDSVPVTQCRGLHPCPPEQPSIQPVPPGQMPCPRCKQRGRITCPGCLGEQWRIDNNNGICGICANIKTIVCPDCGGRGKV